MKRTPAGIEATPRPIPLGDETLSALQLAPKDSVAILTLAHGAGAGMTNTSMAALAEGLAQRDIATLRFNFPYIEKGRKRPDPPPLAHRAVRAAIAEAQRLAPRLPLFAGGRSFGGRMTSQAEALEPTPDLKGLVFFAFPLHAPGKPGIERADHLYDVQAPMLFLSGMRDQFAEGDLLRAVVKKLGKKATLYELEDADHSFRVRAKSGRSNAEILTELLDAARDWMSAQLGD